MIEKYILFNRTLVVSHKIFRSCLQRGRIVIHRVSSQSKKEVMCDPCLSGDERIAATGFCKTCEEPEALCDGCAKQHTRQKATKGHEISNDLTILTNTRKRLIKLECFLFIN